MKSEECFRNSICEDQIQVAERELSSFIGAVTELYGPEQARLSAEDWLEASESIDDPSGSTIRDWRSVTVAASIRLANRLNVVLHHRGSRGNALGALIFAATDTEVSPMPSSNCFASTLLV